MPGWGDLLTFAKGNADWIAPVVGAAAGALSGSKNQTTTQSSAPVLPENVKKGYDTLLGYTEQNFNRPFQARQTMRPETGGNAFQQLFQNPQMQAIQAQSDAEYAGNVPAMMASRYAAQAAAQAPAQSDTQQNVTFPQQDADVVALRRNLQTDPNDMSAAAKMKRLQLYNMETALSNFQDGQVNPTTGEKFDRGRYLNFMQGQADNEVMNPRNSLGFNALTAQQAAPIADEREALYRQTYIPSQSKQSFLGKYGVPIALAAMGMAPGAFAGAGLGTAMTAAPLSASNAIRTLGTIPSLKG